jgi:hypothetical protein
MDDLIHVLLHRQRYPPHYAEEAKLPPVVSLTFEEVVDLADRLAGIIRERRREPLVRVVGEVRKRHGMAELTLRREVGAEVYGVKQVVSDVMMLQAHEKLPEFIAGDMVRYLRREDPRALAEQPWTLPGSWAWKGEV